MNCCEGALKEQGITLFQTETFLLTQLVPYPPSGAPRDR